MRSMEFWSALLRCVFARDAGAVSPVTSYLAIEPRVRPSTEGLDENEGGCREGIGRGSIGTIGRCSGPGEDAGHRTTRRSSPLCSSTERAKGTSAKAVLGHAVRAPTWLRA